MPVGEDMVGAGAAPLPRHISGGICLARLSGGSGHKPIIHYVPTTGEEICQN